MTSFAPVEKPLQQQQQQPMPSDDPSVQMTDVTIETNINPHDETTTTTTTVHLPFQISSQCPPPKIISWMKSRKHTTSATASIRSSKKPSTVAQRLSNHKRHHHTRTTINVQQLFPFLNNRRHNNITDKSKKGDQSITVFSIQVNILGKVLLPPCPTSSTQSTPASQKSTSASASSSPSLPSSPSPTSSSELESMKSIPIKTLPAQLSRSATTSYVIHRTFEDFQRLSEMVLNLRNAITAVHESIPEGPRLTALALHHPHPGLYQTLLKQFSQAKANQRAFDASSTTHGFDEEGAFERILEVNQYLEDVWYWLLPENIPDSLILSVERHDIMQWLKPCASSAHADGRQMRERSEQEASSSSPVTVIPIAQPTVSDRAVTSEVNESPVHDIPTDLVIVKKDEVIDNQQPQVKVINGSPERMSSISSLPSLSSSTSSSITSTSSMSTGMSDNHNGSQRPHHKLDQEIIDGNNDEHHYLDVAAMQGSPHTVSTMASSTLAAPSDILDPLGHHHYPQQMNEDVSFSNGNNSSNHVNILTSAATTMETPSLPEQLVFTKHSSLLQRYGRSSRLDTSSSDASADAKLKRRVSLGQVFRSLTMPSSSHNGHRHSICDAARREILDNDVYIWNTVTTKNLTKHPIVA
ncbi:hypothetical protein FBU30_010170 [Linnemannia zychae]|nr:hypothetical protein FBU30_010170 [Linnemannia zychae]